MERKSSIRGFTLIELVVAVSVLIVLATLSAPMFESVMAGNRTRTAAYALVSTLNYARSEAVKRNDAVSVSAIGAGWQSGWEVESAGDILTMNEPARDLVLSGPLPGVSYLPNGRLNTPGIVLFTVAAPTGYTRCVVIDPGGRATLNPGERNDGSCV